MTAEARITPALARPLRTGWRPCLITLAALELAILILYRRDAADIATIWWSSSTYGHALLVGPVIAWLVIDRLPELRGIAPRGWAPGLAIVVAGGIGWLLGEAAGVAVARHFGLLLMLEGGVIACLGPAAAKAMLFPLGYAVFLVPFGEELVPPLQTLTAQMSMALLHLAGVPAHIDGVFISIPNGLFEVAEACSGVKFLIAMTAYGVLAAHICFRSWGRRLLFVAAAVTAPVLANGVRAFATIYAAHLSSAEAAAGFDHIVYGWIFFALVIAGVTGAAWPFFERAPDAVRIAVPSMPATRPAVLAVVPALALMAAALPPIWSGIATASGVAIPALQMPHVPGWRRVPTMGAPWQPHFAGADRLQLGRYQDDQGRKVDLAIATYGRQGEGRELVGYGQGALDPASDWAWIEDSAAPFRGRAFRIAAPGPVSREVLTFYRLRGVTTGSEHRVKLETLKARLLGGPQAAVALIVSAEELGGRKGGARAALDAFLGAMGPVDRVADRAAGL